MGQAQETPGHLGFDGKTFLLRFQPLPDVLADVKQIPGRRWDAEKELWTAPARRDAADSLLRIARGRAWIIDPEAQQTIEGLLAPYNRAHDMVAGVASKLTPPVTTNVFEHAQDWLATQVRGYRELRPGTADVMAVLQALDLLGYTPFGFSKKGELGYASEPGFIAVRASQLSHRLNHPRFQWITRKRRR